MSAAKLLPPPTSVIMCGAGQPREVQDAILRSWDRSFRDSTGVRRSKRLAAKPAVDYAEEKLRDEAAQRRLDRRGGLSWNSFVLRVQAECICSYLEAMKEASRRQRGLAPRSAADFEAGRLERMATRARAAQARAEKAVARQQLQKERKAAKLLAKLEKDLAALEKDLSGPALTYTEATGCADLPPPPPLRRTCRLPGCDEHCPHCRENDRLAAANRDWNPFREPKPVLVPELFRGSASSGLGMQGPALPAFPGQGLAPPVSSAGGVGGLAPPPIGATVIRVPVDLRLMTQAALNELIAAAQAALPHASLF